MMDGGHDPAFYGARRHRCRTWPSLLLCALVSVSMACSGSDQSSAAPDVIDPVSDRERCIQVVQQLVMEAQEEYDFDAYLAQLAGVKDPMWASLGASHSYFVEEVYQFGRRVASEQFDKRIAQGCERGGSLRNSPYIQQRMSN
jgi:hypothetical protein